MSLVRKLIMITGASRGLGRELARYLWSKGASLVLVSRDLHALRDVLVGLQTHFEQKVYYFSCDLSDQYAVEKLIIQIETFRFDAIINNAAIQGPIGNLQDNDWVEWVNTIQVNLLAPVYICRAMVRKMISVNGKSGGSIINLSGGGATSPRPNFSAYATAKSGIVGFSATFAEEMRSHGIRVNVVAPGPLPTDMLRQVIQSGQKSAGQAEIKSAIGVLNNSSDSMLKVAKLCEFLINSESKKITGKLISALWDNWEEFPNFPGEVLDSDLYTLRRIVQKDRPDLFK